MVRFTVSAAAAVLAFCSQINATPVNVRQEEEVHPIGFDESFARRFPAGAAVPKVQTLNIDELVHNSTEAPGFTPFPSETEAGEVDKRFIIGADDRHLWNDPNYPFIAVGRLLFSNGVFCSGAMIGPRLVLTARHCYVEGVPGVFAPGYDNGNRYGEAQLTNVLFTTGQEPASACDTKGDWAIYALDQHLGDRVGYFGAKLPDHSMLDQPKFFHIGYPGDKDGGRRPYRQTDITIHSKPRTFDCDSTGPIWTDADTMGGQSGGPLWELDGSGNRWIWGTLSVGVQSSTEAYSGFASGNNMVDGIIYMRNQFP
ncbi:hypothetical protein CGMCC3_g13902 [Colletotrichum fructicola]|uniref:Serine protease n=1 Tax=Colletotrichum fructicola (strain Nara gc5) TaxID=1213859 RepID=L2FC80_COLFN|nr:uncharacterized protein CGMCC3_g13902 [Colletotrichum fructicola]KAF4478944.1 Glutamyl endopeptidase [Colletotrichum fructicola Nara gc5]KAI8281134.1 hypothetical protein K4K60_004411 [Colletotrichum sp. SAR11_57]KAE9570039.1 hypothetical protein CGMCC3_g13902 [Colletotrichum fructicola]KAF4434380.1 Glutamyl endopeptidase [Colletotrichum fructicola]KAF4882488.1 Glutamyl endopeptidase [Colletotrichum fructicola]